MTIEELEEFLEEIENETVLRSITSERIVTAFRGVLDQLQKPNYKVYKALIGKYFNISWEEEITSGELEIGKHYVIYDLQSGDDFSNVGFNELEVIFEATGTTPTNWSNETVVYPAIVLQMPEKINVLTNTTGETFNWTFDPILGTPICQVSGGILLENKTVVNVNLQYKNSINALVQAIRTDNNTISHIQPELINDQILNSL